MFANTAADDRGGVGCARFCAYRLSDNSNLLELGEGIDDFLAHPLAKIAHISVRASVLKRKDRDRIAGRKSGGNRRFETRRAAPMKDRRIAAFRQLDSHLFMPAFFFVVTSQSRAQSARLHPHDGICPWIE